MKGPHREQRIAYPDNPFMAAAWLSALRFASCHPEIVAAYEEDQGRKFLFFAERSPLDAMIDQATGAEAVALDDFVDWFNEVVWGDDPFAPSEEESE